MTTTVGTMGTITMDGTTTMTTVGTDGTITTTTTTIMTITIKGISTSSLEFHLTTENCPTITTSKNSSEEVTKIGRGDLYW